MGLLSDGGWASRVWLIPLPQQECPLTTSPSSQGVTAPRGSTQGPPPPEALPDCTSCGHPALCPAHRLCPKCPLSLLTWGQATGKASRVPSLSVLTWTAGSAMQTAGAHQAKLSCSPPSALATFYRRGGQNPERPSRPPGATQPVEGAAGLQAQACLTPQPLPRALRAMREARGWRTHGCPLRSDAQIPLSCCTCVWGEVPGATQVPARAPGPASVSSPHPSTGTRRCAIGGIEFTAMGGRRTVVLDMGHLSRLTVLGMSTANAKMNDGCKYSQT